MVLQHLLRPYAASNTSNNVVETVGSTIGICVNAREQMEMLKIHRNDSGGLNVGREILYQCLNVSTREWPPLLQRWLEKKRVGVCVL